MSGVLFYAGAIGFLLGVATRTFLNIGWPEIIALMVVAIGVGLVWRKNRGAIFAPYVRAVAVLLCFIALGVVRMQFAAAPEPTSSLAPRVGSEMSLEGEIVREPDVRARTQHLYTKVGNDLILVTTDRFGTYAYGDEIRFTGELTRPEAFETDLGRTFNYPGYLKAQGVGYMMQFAQVKGLESGRGNPVVTSLLHFKHYFESIIEQLIPEPQVGLAEGLLLGEKRALGDDLNAVFRRVGIIHIVVLSGYNIMLVILFTMYVLSYVMPFRGRLILGLGAIVAFALLVGLSATVLRASIMAALLLIAKLTSQTYEIMRALLFAAVVMVLFNPYVLAFDPGFQLSFLATLALILIAPDLEARLIRVPNIKFLPVREFLVATLATQLFVLPFLLYQIGEFSIVAVVVNVLVLPMVAVAMLLTFITGLIGMVSVTLAVPVAYGATFSLAYILLVAEWFAALPFAVISVPAFPFWVVIIAYTGLGWGVWRYSQMWRPIATQGGTTTTVQPEISLNGWVIEEEKESAGAVAKATAPADLPIFFR